MESAIVSMSRKRLASRRVTNKRPLEKQTSMLAITTNLVVECGQSGVSRP